MTYIVLIFLFLLSCCNAPAHAEETQADTSYPRPYELLDTMNKFQRFADKLYFAGVQKNKRLTGWYLWKLEQAALDVTNGLTKPWHPPHVDEVELLKGILFPAIRSMEATLEKDDWPQFSKDYDAVIGACNTCHAATDHAYIKITVPKVPTYGNQDYTADNW